MKIAGSKIYIVAVITTFMLLISGCSKKIIRSLQKGSIGATEFYQAINAEYKGGLLIIPVTIEQKTYRFMLDSGAPLCISEKLQKERGFKIITSGHITDTDGMTSSTDIVKVDSIFLGAIPFIDQSAFVLDMQAHPLIKCMNVDGIIGSNLMRFCNWKINILDKQIILSDQIKLVEHKNSSILPFNTDFQHNILLNIHIDTRNFGGFTLDYGSNGYLSVYPRMMKDLLANGILDTAFNEYGYRQAGILGHKRKAESDIAYTDKVLLNTLPLDSIELRTSQNQLIGTAILKRFEVGIDWTEHLVQFTKLDSVKVSLKSPGIKIGYTDGEGFYVMRVQKGSPAFNAGIKPGMRILKMDSLNLKDTANYCKHIEYWSILKDSLSIKCEDSEGIIRSYKLKNALPEY